MCAQFYGKHVRIATTETALFNRVSIFSGVIHFYIKSIHRQDTSIPKRRLSLFSLHMGLSHTYTLGTCLKCRLDPKDLGPFKPPSYKRNMQRLERPTT